MLLGFQVASIAWRVSREVDVANQGDITWLPPADIINLISMLANIIGVFLLPILGITDPGLAKYWLGFSVLLYVGYPFALFGHYDMYVPGPRSYKYATFQEKIVVLLISLACVAYVIAVLWAR